MLSLQIVGLFLGTFAATTAAFYAVTGGGLIGIVLGQVDPVTASKALSQDPLAYMLIIAFLTIAYLFRDNRARENDLRKEISDLHVKLAETIRADAKEQREILMTATPLLTKLTEGLEILERVTDSLSKD